MTTKQLYIHIGHYKTGTTALQVFCTQNRKLLAKNGVNYASIHHERAKHSKLAFGLFRAAGVTTLMHGYAKEDAPEDFWRELFDEVRSAKQPKTLVSSEEFMRIGEFQNAAEHLGRIVKEFGQGIDIRIIVYLRPVEAQLRSWYNQMVKMNQKIGDFDSAISDGSIESIHYDYFTALKPWIDLFGRDAVELRRYPDRSAPKSALLEDFFSVLGVDIDADQEATNNDLNPRMDDRMLDAVRFAQNLGLKKHGANNLRERVARFVAVQDEMQRAPGGLDIVQKRAKSGLAQLADIAGENMDDLAAPIPPRPLGPDLDAVALQVGYLTSETVRLTREIEHLSGEARAAREAREKARATAEARIMPRVLRRLKRGFR